METFFHRHKKIKYLENEIVKVTPNLDKNILLELHRIAHRTFPWQNSPDRAWIARYFKIFNRPDLDLLLEEKLGLKSKEIFSIGFALTGGYLKSFALHGPMDIPGLGLTKEKFKFFLSQFSRDLLEIKRILIESQKYDYDFVYTINQLRVYPLIKIVYRRREAYICPIPTFLFWRFTEGIYYEICDHPKFGHFFGESFQSYVGEVLIKAKGANQVLYSEEEYFVSKNRKDTIDWVVEDNGFYLFIECKTKKLRANSKFSLVDTASLYGDLDKMADFIIQAYGQIYDFLNGRYPFGDSKGVKKIFPVILTLADWYAFGDKIMEILDAKLEKRLISFPPEFKKYLKIFPYTICSINDFEMGMQIMGSVGVEAFMTQKLEGERRMWAMDSYIRNYYSEEYSNLNYLFPEEFNSLIPEMKG